MQLRYTIPVMMLSTAGVLGTVHTSPSDGDQSTLSVKFAGGSAAEYVASVREQLIGANVLCDEGLQGIDVPPIELHNVTLDAALAYLNDRQFQTDRAVVDVHVRGYDDHDPKTNDVHVIETTSQQRIDDEDLQTVVMAVGDLLGGSLHADDLIDVIEAALSLERDPRIEVQARFHEATGLILARGTRSQMQAVQAVIEQVRVSASRSETRNDRDREVHTLLTNVQQLQNELNSQQALAVDLNTRRAELDAQQQIYRQQVDELHAQLRDREDMIMQLRSELQSTRTLIADLQAQLAHLEARARAKTDNERSNQPRR